MSTPTVRDATQQHLAGPQFPVLLDAARVLSSCRGRDEILANLPVELARVIAVDYLSVHCLQANPSAWFTAPDGTSLQAAAPPPEAKLAAEVLANQQPLSVQGAASPLSALGIDALYVVPLAGLKNTGVLVAGRRGPAGFAPQEQQLLAFLGSQVSTAIILEDAEKRYQRAELILKINNNIAASLELHELLRSTAQSLRTALRCDVATITLPQPGETHLMTFAMDFPDSRGFFHEGTIIPMDGTVLGQVYRSGQRMVVGEPQGDTDPVYVRARAEGIRSACFCPLIHKGRTLGLLTAARRSGEMFDEPTAGLLEDVAHQVAIALDNSMAYEKISELKDQLAQEKLYLEDEIRDELHLKEFIGNSAPLQRVLKQIATVAPTDSNVLIYGETGSGKELVARGIHELSRRSGNTFVRLNCAAIPAGLLESELFGHEKGAFTGAVAQRVGRFELAHRGTLFLDEIGELPLDLQPKLLRVLQEREFERLGSSRTLKTDARVIAATNRDLAQMVDQQKLRADLFYRLNVFPIHVPPLRERPEDIPLLVRHFVHQFARRMNKTVDTIPTETMTVLTRYSWPGNIRELQNLMERAMILSSGQVLRVPLEELKANAVAVPSAKQQTLADAERAHIVSVLQETKWVLAGAGGAAAKLGMNRSTLRFRMGKLGIRRPGEE